jgi:molecular chaperone GrpE
MGETKDKVDLTILKIQEDADDLDSDESLDHQETSGEKDDRDLDRERLLHERNDFRDLLQRKQAEFENYRKRVIRERDETRRLVRSELIADLLPIVEACEKGLESMDSEDAGGLASSFVEGYQLLLKQLMSFLDKYDVSQVPGVGANFDPNLHEAVIRESSNQHRDGEILEEYRKGYLIGERLLRPSQVKVAVHSDDAGTD